MGGVNEPLVKEVNATLATSLVPPEHYRSHRHP